MAGRGRTPKRPDEERHPRSRDPERPWKSAAGEGWQHGDTPAVPDGLMPASDEAWRVWFSAWFAAFWSPDDLPGLRQLVRLYDQVERGEFHRAGELRLQMDTYGITPKGQQDRRWIRPKADDKPQGKDSTPRKYNHLRSVSGA